MVEQKDAPVDFGILLGLAYQSFTDLLRAFLAKRGFADLGGAYGYVFRALADDRPSQRELAGRLGITDQGMAKIIAEMIQRRYVERHADPDDSRVKRLSLGKRGRDALKVARQFHAEFEGELRKKAGESAVRGLRQLLQQIAQRGDDHDVASARLRPT